MYLPLDLLVIVFSYSNDVAACLKLLKSKQEVPKFLGMSDHYLEHYWFAYSNYTPTLIFTKTSNDIKSTLGILLKERKINTTPRIYRNIDNFAKHSGLNISATRDTRNKRLRIDIVLMDDIPLNTLTDIFN
jgi:hypothetical protein